jgi:hypothetical protein
MDVVYNHTYDANSSFNKIVPYYYYRYTATGANSSASGCGNDTASERYMFGKFMVDSVRYWAEEYDLDGFRFDLMGLHDLATMQEVENAVQEARLNHYHSVFNEGYQDGMNRQRKLDLMAATKAFLELKVGEQDIFRLLNKYFKVDSITEASGYLNKAKVNMQIGALVEYCRKTGMTSAEAKQFICFHDVEKLLLTDERLLNMQPAKLKAIIEKK